MAYSVPSGMKRRDQKVFLNFSHYYQDRARFVSKENELIFISRLLLLHVHLSSLCAFS
jgi:hypothetical protein